MSCFWISLISSSNSLINRFSLFFSSISSFFSSCSNVSCIKYSRLSSSMSSSVVSHCPPLPPPEPAVCLGKRSRGLKG
ncbi:hypothetical protein PFISCL1PPCAC_9377, partial [Pristionchus fissidentatus]